MRDAYLLYEKARDSVPYHVNIIQCNAVVRRMHAHTLA